jgi:hypothetical protein
MAVCYVKRWTAGPRDDRGRLDTEAVWSDAETDV